MERLQSLLANFTDVVRASIQELEKVKQLPDYQIVLSHSAEILAHKIIAIGDFTAEQHALNNATKEVYLAHNILLFDWMEKAKDFLILCQDTLFQNQKAQVLQLDQRVSDAEATQLKMLSTQLIEEAAEDLLAYFENKIQNIKAGGKVERTVSNYEIQHSPYPIYRKQIEQIIMQIGELEAPFALLQSVSENFVSIHALIQNNKTTCQTEMEQLRQVATRIIDFIQVHQAEKVGKIIPFIKEQEGNLSSIDETQFFIRNLENILGQLPETSKIFTQTDESILVYKEINFIKNTRQWLETESLPAIYELRDLKESAKQNLKMAFLNISNRITLLSNQKQEDNSRSIATMDLCQALHTFLDKLTKWQMQFSEEYSLLQKKMEENLIISSVYVDTQNFLSIPLQATINQLRNRPTRWLDGVQNWWRRQMGIVEDIQRHSKKVDALSTSEKIVRLIQHRRTDINNSYASIFLTQGYIGEAFCAGRVDEFLHIEQVIAAWKSGFRGTVLLSGQCFSGKTLFGDSIANRYFPKQSVRLAPNTLLEVDGRRMTSDYDLEKSLDFIRKNTINKQMLIWIDDLELWNDQQLPLGKNVAALCTYLEKYYTQFFFVVAMNNGLRKRLYDLHDIGEKFQTEINLDQMPLKEVQEAILIRHSATHKQLVLADRKEVNSKLFDKITTRIYRAANGNIGDALVRWAFSTTEGKENTVLYTQKEQYTLPEFMDADTAILLRALVLEKRSNEYRLRKLFGELFKERYSPILQRLLGVGVLTRHIDGWLEINPVIANDIGHLLEAEQYLNFHHNK